MLEPPVRGRGRGDLRRDRPARRRRRRRERVRCSRSSPRWRPRRRNIAHGGLAFARTCSSSRSAHERAAEIMDRLQAAAATRCRSSSCTAPTRASCAPSSRTSTRRSIALVLAHMTPDKASLVLSGLPPEQQAEVAHRIAVMDRTSPEIIRARRGQPRAQAVLGAAAVGAVPRRRRRPAGRHHQPVRPRHRAADRRGPGGARRRARRRGPQPDVHVRGHRHARRPRRCSWCCARSTRPSSHSPSRASASAVRDKITSNLSERAAENLLEEIDLLGPVRLDAGRGGPAVDDPQASASSRSRARSWSTAGATMSSSSEHRTHVSTAADRPDLPHRRLDPARRRPACSATSATEAVLGSLRRAHPRAPPRRRATPSAGPRATRPAAPCGRRGAAVAAERPPRCASEARAARARRGRRRR